MTFAEKVADVKQLVQLVQGGTRRSTLAKTASFLRNGRRILGVMPDSTVAKAEAGTPPDYGELRSWVAHPTRPRGEGAIEDVNHLAEADVELPSMHARPCDCFWVVDTCYLPDVSIPFQDDRHSRRWNVPLGTCEGNDSVAKLCAKVREQWMMRTAAAASCFNRTCRVYAPEYRQATIFAFLHIVEVARLAENPRAKRNALLKPEEAVQAFDLAYDDVRCAFLHFVDDPANAERPFILAGHSQGSVLLQRLLQEEVEPHPVRLRRFVHAYLAGWATPIELFEQTLRMIRPSTSAHDTRTVSSWRTAAASHPDIAILRSVTFISGRGWRSIQSSKLLANNPVTWSCGSEERASEPEEHRGALWPLPSNMDPRDHRGEIFTSGTSLRFGHLSSRSTDVLGVKISSLVPVDCGPMIAKVDQAGVLRVSTMRPDSLFGMTESDWILYHDLDFALFNNNLQDNVAQRVQAWKMLPSRL